MRNISLRKITASALLAGLALVSFVIESLFPPLFIPGARLGVSNVFILLSAILLGAPYAYVALIIKSVLGSLFAGNISAIMYSLPAGIIALTLELLALKFTKFISLPAISVLGAVISNVIQNLTFCIITGVWEYMSYIPYLALLGIISGLIVGFTTYLIIKILPQSVSDKLNA